MAELVLYDEGIVIGYDEGHYGPPKLVSAELLMWLHEQYAVTGLTCQMHPAPYAHRPTPLRLVLHHVQPIGMGGPNVAANRVLTCDTGHYNTHRILGCFMDSKPIPRGAGRERELAQQGFDEWVAQGHPGSPVYQFD